MAEPRRGQLSPSPERSPPVAAWAKCRPGPSDRRPLEVGDVRDAGEQQFPEVAQRRSSTLRNARKPTRAAWSCSNCALTAGGRATRMAAMKTNSRTPIPPAPTPPGIRHTAPARTPRRPPTTWRVSGAVAPGRAARWPGSATGVPARTTTGPRPARGSGAAAGRVAFSSAASAVDDAVEHLGVEQHQQHRHQRHRPGRARRWAGPWNCLIPNQTRHASATACWRTGTGSARAVGWRCRRCRARHSA